ncbi:MAG: GNAT family N-acetyltransferase [Candidatus Berkelbacteria bacterium]|nr:GNAT family N-acetyltransferase [Candidatus Berkelbacteria bacterium]
MKSEELKIIEARFSNHEAKIVQAEIRKSADITGYSRRELLRQKNVFKGFIDGEFAGSCINFEFGENWTELSGFIVAEKFRGQGIGKMLFESAYQSAIKNQKNIFVVSRNPAMKKIINPKEFKIIRKFRQLPQVIKLHEFRFAISWYRFLELIRKSFSLKKSGKIVYYTKKFEHL